MSAPLWTVRGEVPFRPDGGIPQLAQLCLSMLESYLDTVEAKRSDRIALDKAPAVPEPGAIDSRSIMSLLLRGREAAGIWVRFGTDYVVQGEVDNHTEPAIVDAALAAFRDHPGAGYRPRGSTKRGRVRVLVVLEWPGALLVRAQDSTHAELMLLPARLPTGGSAIGVVLGELETGLVVDRASVVPLSAGRFCEALEAAADRLTDLPAEQVRRIPLHNDRDESEGPVPLAVDEEWDADESDQPAVGFASVIQPGFEHPDESDEPALGFGSVVHPVIEDEDQDQPLDGGFSVGGMSDSFGMPEEPRPPSSRSHLEEIITSPGATAPRGEVAVLPWDLWLDAVGGASLAPAQGLDEATVPALLDLDEGDIDPPGRAVGGWLTPDGARVPWGPPHPLGDRSRVPMDVMRVLSGVSGSAALVLFGWAIAAIISFLVQPHDAQVQAAAERANIPTISFCSASNPAFVEAVHCWTDRFAGGIEDLESSACDQRPGADPDLSAEVARTAREEISAEGRAAFCGLAHRLEGSQQGARADEVLAEACFQVLGRPEQYADPARLRAGRPAALVSSFLSDDRLRIQELAEVRQDLRDDCDQCESASLERVRDRAVLAWLDASMRPGMPVSSIDAAELDRCTARNPLWRARRRDGDSESSKKQDKAYAAAFPYDRYTRLRFLGSTGSKPAEWSCYDHSESSRYSSMAQPPAPLGLAARLVTPRNLSPPPLPADDLGKLGVRSQLGLHMLLDGELQGSGARAAGAIACASLVQKELSTYSSVHPLLIEGDGSVPDLCGQVCAGYFRVAQVDKPWETAKEDLKLCVTGRVDPRAPERLCPDRTLPIPRSSREEGLSDGADDLLKNRWASHKELDARWSPGAPKRWLIASRGTSNMDTNDTELGEDCGITEQAPGADEPGASFFYKPKKPIRYDIDDGLTEGQSAATIGALPDPILACSARLITQENLSEAGLPTLLPGGSLPETYVESVRLVADQLADESLTVQRSRQACEELAALCFTSAALMVNRPDMLWDYADLLTTRNTAEDLALAMGPTLERTFRRECVPKPEAGRSRGRCPAEWQGGSPAAICDAVCRAGAINYSLPARNALPEARLDAAFALATATPVCSGLQDLWDDRNDADLSFESSCLDGLEAQRSLAIQLLQGGR